MQCSGELRPGELPSEMPLYAPGCRRARPPARTRGGNKKKQQNHLPHYPEAGAWEGEVLCGFQSKGHLRK